MSSTPSSLRSTGTVRWGYIVLPDAQLVTAWNFMPHRSLQSFCNLESAPEFCYNGNIQEQITWEEQLGQAMEEVLQGMKKVWVVLSDPSRNSHLAKW